MDNPVCLFLHGGPGLSLPYGISSRHQLETISSHCTVVYWDQRGAGKTYSTNPSDVSFTYEQVEADAKELITYLRREFRGRSNLFNRIFMGECFRYATCP